jgi:CRISPR system Cascade subunit CasD
MARAPNAGGIMPRFLILKLDGVLQAWGGHSFEDYRPSHNFPTRSGLVGLLGACLGMERKDAVGIESLNSSFRYAARVDAERAIAGREKPKTLRGMKLTDFHTVLNARTVKGGPRDMPVVSTREYWCDTVFTVALQATDSAAVSLETIAEATRRPRYTPSLGRRACALSRPLFERWCEAESLHAALALVPPVGGVIYSEEMSSNVLRVRDVPMPGRTRQFATRELYLHSGDSKS